MTRAILNGLVNLRDRRERGALCTIVQTEGSTPLKAGAQMLVSQTGALLSGTIGGGALEYAVLAEVTETIAMGESRLTLHRLTRDHQMCCGGSVLMFIEVLEPPPQCFIFGAGHIGKALAALIPTLDFEVTLIDGRANLKEQNPESSALSPQSLEQDLRTQHSGLRTSSHGFINDDPERAIDSLVWDTNTYVIIATHSHALDRALLRRMFEKPFHYCGMIGSKRKVLITRKLFREHEWATDEELDRIDMPIGVDIVASSPAEIAVSIAARMIERKNRIAGKEETKRLGIATSVNSIRGQPLIVERNHDFSCTRTAL